MIQIEETYKINKGHMLLTWGCNDAEVLNMFVRSQLSHLPKPM